MMPVIAHNDVERFRLTVARRLGLHYDEGKIDFLTDVLRQRMEATGSSGFDSYLERLGSAQTAKAEIGALAEKLTVTETFFFRNADHFRAFAEAVLPERVRAKAHTKHLRILSAGCASGEEPYSLAAVVRERVPDLAAWDVKIFGLDINPAVLAKARQARYPAWSLRATEEDTRRRSFRTEGRDFVLDPLVQRMVSFEERNLADPDPAFWPPGAFDIIFCRNVIMYFTPETMREVVHRIGQALLPGGFFFLGHAETLRGLSQDFHLCHTHDTFYYRRRLPFEASTTSAEWSPCTTTELAKTLPTVVETATSWVGVIQRASERIASLADGGARSLEDDRDLGPTVQPVARAWDFGLVLEAMRQERFADALELLRALPPDAEQEPDALLLRGVLLTNGGQLDEAESVCRRLLALDELNAGAHYVMALCREHASDTSGAIDHDQTAVYLDAAFAMPHVHLGLIARRAGNAATARRELSQALTLLAREDASRLLLFGGGFTRETLVQLCRTELRTVGGEG